MADFQCGTCNKKCKSQGGLRRHIDSKHAPSPAPFHFPSPDPVFRTPSPLPNPPSPFSPRRTPRRRHNGSPVRLPWSAAPINLRRYGTQTETHPLLDGTPCDLAGDDLPSDSAPMPPEEHNHENYSPFNSDTEFELAEFLYQKVEILLGPERGMENPWANHEELYGLIDEIRQGDIQWESFTVKYNGYEVWFRDPLKILEQMLANPSFKSDFDVTPKRLFNKGKRLYRDLMTGNWAWFQCDKIARDENTHGAMFVPVILGSDKTTVSVATGQNDFYPLYISLGNVHSSVRRAHRNAVALLGFLSVPKTSKDHSGSAEFRKFRRQLFHTSLEHALSSLRPHMTIPRVTLCPDGRYRRVIYGLGPYIADYPEQALLTCIVQNWCPRCMAPPDDLDSTAGRRSHEHTDSLLNGCTLKELWDDYGIVPFTASFPRADIHQLISPDLLHQLVKGTFKDHLVDWVFEYLDITYSKKEADERKADIDRRIAATTPYPGLRNFHEGRGFKQWTGDDSKGLMKIFLPAIVGHVPSQMVKAIQAFLEFCYLARRDVIDEDTLSAMDTALMRFHQHREIFRTTGVRPEGTRWSIIEYLIQQFGAPNGLCSSITESKHIKAVKCPWRRSSKHNALGQMLITNQHLDKLATYRIDLESQGMLKLAPTVAKRLEANLPPPPEDQDDEEGPTDEPYSQGDVKLSKRAGVPRSLATLAEYVEQPTLPILIRQFLFNQNNPDAPVGMRGCDVPLDSCPELPNTQRIFLHHSARATFFAPSDMSGLGGMRHERICSVKSWPGGPARYDCVFMEGDSDKEGFAGLLVGRVFMFFHFAYQSQRYECALIQWYSTVGDRPCDETGLWMVDPDFDREGSPNLEVVHIDCLYRGAHLIGVTGDSRLPTKDFSSSDSLDAYSCFYVNKYIDYHAHEIAF
ncbi:hypothetical protein BT96DRAFT_965641 [Gymnopus androsaceus JB14]|uniref:C2H2-type domain-containing protein n=1 Tax=Gymnopus androsaceus JB14 TaxID=1447944 RepID=A0A6A4HNX4_9AGAR|nr:hypothetical protein BT96DRAFT_965641 [Gymnopus androsaceus JB14]